MKFYLIRHGQTEWNIAGKIQGKTDVPLNQTGIRQAALLAEAMERKMPEYLNRGLIQNRHHSVAAIYSSPLKRAEETARIVSTRLTSGGESLPVIFVKELAEVNFGLWEGLTWELINARYPEDFSAWDKNPVESTPTGGETKESCKARCRQGMDFILSHAEGDIIIVAHGGILVFVVDYLLRRQKERNEIIVKNASITTIEYDRETGVGTLLFLNDTSHLISTSHQMGVMDNKTNK